MAKSTATALLVSPRDAQGSREARRLRRRGLVLGVVYGGDSDPRSFQVDARELRHALAASGAVIDLRIGEDKASPVVIKEVVHHPVNGEITHLDLIRVRLDVEIQAVVTLELTGIDEAPGVVSGGVLEHATREVTVEALPNEIPDSISHDVSTMEVGDTLTLETVAAASSFKIIGDDETVVASITPPRLQTEGDDEIETETEVVGEGAKAASADGSGAQETSGEGPGEGAESA